MRTISIRQLQRNLYQELDKIPVLVTRRIITKERKYKVVPLCWVLPYDEDDAQIIDGLYEELTKEEQAYVDSRKNSPPDQPKQIEAQNTTENGTNAGLSYNGIPVELRDDVPDNKVYITNEEKREGKVLDIETGEVEELVVTPEVIKEPEPEVTEVPDHVEERDGRYYCKFCGVWISRLNQADQHYQLMHLGQRVTAIPTPQPPPEKPREDPPKEFTPVRSIYNNPVRVPDLTQEPEPEEKPKTGFLGKLFGRK